jgi:hypothetical protein
MSELHYEFTHEDLKALLGWHSSPELERRRALHRRAGTAWLALMGVSLLIGLHAPVLAWPLALGVPLLFWWRYPIESRRRAERVAAAQLSGADRGGRVGPCTLLLGELALVLRTPAGEQVHGWEDIEQVVTGDTLLLLLTRANGVVALPRRVVPEAAALEAYRRRVRSEVA